MIKLFGCAKQVCVLQLSISYCVSLIYMVTITRYVFINIVQTEHFPAVQFDLGYEKNMSFRVIPKSPKVWKKVRKLDSDSFKVPNSVRTREPVLVEVYLLPRTLLRSCVLKCVNMLISVSQMPCWDNPSRFLQ